MPIQDQISIMSLNDYLAQRGLGVISVPPDGDCFYHAIEIVTGIGFMSDYDGTTLRKLIADEVSKESVWNELSPIAAGKTKAEYIAAILTNGTWFEGDLIQTVIPRIIKGYLTVHYYDYEDNEWTSMRFGEKEYDNNYQLVWYQHTSGGKAHGVHYDAVVSVRLVDYYREKKIETALSKVVLPLTNNMSEKLTFDPAPTLKTDAPEYVPTFDFDPIEHTSSRLPWDEHKQTSAHGAFHMPAAMTEKMLRDQQEERNRSIDSALEKAKLQHQMELERVKHSFELEKMQLELDQAKRAVEMMEKVSTGTLSFAEDKAKREREMSEYLESVREREIDRMYNVTVAVTNQLGMINSRQLPQTVQPRPALPGTAPRQLPAPQKTQEKARMIEIPKEANRRQISVINSLIDSGKKAQAETMIERIRNGENV